MRWLNKNQSNLVKEKQVTRKQKEIKELFENNRIVEVIPSRIKNKDNKKEKLD